MLMRVFTLTLVRHGETDDNVNRIIQGQKDTALNENGREQARQLGMFFAKQNPKFSLIYASDLTRTVETAKLALGDLPAEISHEKRIRERSFGVLEGLPFLALKEAAQKKNKTTASYRPEGGESNVDLRARAAKYFKDLCHQVFNCSSEVDHVALFTHGGWIRELSIYFVNELNCELPKGLHQATQVSPNTAVTSFQVTSDLNNELNVQMVKWHDISHLQPDQPVIISLGI